jgi:hypothetical protein
MLDPLDYARFIESAWLLGPKAFTYGKIDPHYNLRAALHLEAGPNRCVRGLKSSLVIGQKAQIGPNPFTPRGRVDLVV